MKNAEPSAIVRLSSPAGVASSIPVASSATIAAIQRTDGSGAASYQRSVPAIARNDAPNIVAVPSIDFRPLSTRNG